MGRLPWLSAVIALLAAAAAAGDAVLEVGPFSRHAPGGLPPGWKPLTFQKVPQHTRYELVRDGDRVVVRADARAGASGLIRDIRIDPREYPVVEWRWKVANLLERADIARQDGDDYPARLYIVFRSDRDQLSVWEKVKIFFYRLLYGEEPPTGALNYIWDAHAPPGAIVPNAYTSRVRMIVVESGAVNLNRWMTVERNLLDDYRAAFAHEPPPVVGVAIMTDTDNTGESATAWYGDIVFKRTAAP
jgi:hypothetical protein